MNELHEARILNNLQNINYRNYFGIVDAFHYNYGECDSWKKEKKKCFFCCTLLFFNVLIISFPI